MKNMAPCAVTYVFHTDQSHLRNKQYILAF